MDDTNELIARLSTAAGIVMEDSTPLALTARVEDDAATCARLIELEQAGKDATVLIQAAQVLARRQIR